MAGKRRRKKAKPTIVANDSNGEFAPPPPSNYPTSQPSRSIWVKIPWIVVIILVIGAGLRLWGITERCFVDPDTAGHYMGGEVYRQTWRWYHSAAHDTKPLLDYLDDQMGLMAVAKFDNGKPLDLMLRGLIIFLTGERSLVAHFVLDIAFALTAMGLILLWCHRHLGVRITLLAGCLWLVNAFHFQCTGRGYDYSALMLCGSLAWLAFMGRNNGRVYLKTFLAGLSIGVGITYHYTFFNYFPLLAVFLLLYRNPSGIKGKLLEVTAFIAGFAVMPLCIIALYEWLTSVTGTEWKWGIISPLFQQGNTFSDMTLSLRFYGNAWFMWQFLCGYLFMVCLILGVVAIGILHVRHYGWRWSICDDPLFILNGVTAYGLLIWGIYHCSQARVQIPEITAWPVVAALGLHHTTRLLSNKLLRKQGLTVIQGVLVAAIMLEQWPRTAPLLKMGSGLLETMRTISEEGKTAAGEGAYWGMWPCTSNPTKPLQPTHPLTQWECLDDYLTANNYDYFYVHYGRLLTHMVMYPGAGHQLMLSTYNRLFTRSYPIRRFKFGAPINARLDNMNMNWVRQTYCMNAWRKLHPDPTQYDVFIEREPYIDVFPAKDVIACFYESRINLLAQLMVLHQKDPQRFQEIAPRFHNFIQYNATNSAVMTQAQDAIGQQWK